MRLNLTIERRDPATGEYFDPWHDGYDYDEDNPFKWSVRGWWYNSRLRRALRRAWDRVRGRKPYKPGVAEVVWFKSGMVVEREDVRPSKHWWDRGNESWNNGGDDTDYLDWVEKTWKGEG